MYAHFTYISRYEYCAFGVIYVFFQYLYYIIILNLVLSNTVVKI